MLASNELIQLLLNVEDIARDSKEADKQLFTPILKEIRKTLEKVADGEVKSLAAIRKLNDTYLEIQAS